MRTNRHGSLILLGAWTIMALTTIGGCHLGPESLTDPDRLQRKDLPRLVKEEVATGSQARQETHAPLEKIAGPKLDIEPIMPAYDPLRDKNVSFSMVDEDMRTVLFVLAQAVGMNLIIDPAVATEEKRITLHFEKVPASVVLRQIVKNFDLTYEIDGNVIAIRPFEERLFSLNFLDSEMSSTFDVGGDVLGSGSGNKGTSGTASTESASGLSGTFKISGEAAKKSNPYDLIETMIKPLISPQGKVTLNRSAGSLFVRDTPASLRAVEKMINNFKEMSARQIKIDAQIIEVVLGDEYRYGIDWSALRNFPGSGNSLSSASWALGTGLVLSGTSGEYSLSSVVNALNQFGQARVVSNPTIRCKHGKPAIISVGTSYTYKKSVKTTTTGGGVSPEHLSTEVNVSTVFDGLILGVVPFIEPSRRISLLINPIKSEVDSASLEPQKVGSQDTDSISLPKIQIKEINTTIALNSGDAVILGGLIDKRQTVLNKGVPILSAIPILGYLFKNEYKKEESRELVLILSVSLV